MQRALLLALLGGVVLASSASAFVVPASKLVGAPCSPSSSLRRAAQAQAQTPAATSRALLPRLMAMKQIGVGVIGAGRIGIVHLEALAGCPEAKPIIISNPTVSKAKEAAAKFNLPEFTDDAMKVINHPDVDAVWICSPSQYHADQIKACAAAGKHVFCEKPIATGLAETIEAINTCREANVKLMTALQRRFDPNFARVKRAILEGEVGNVVQVKLCSRDPSPPPFEYVKGGGGIFKDMAVHDLDMSRFLVGTEPESILAFGSCHVDPRIQELPGAEAFDTAVIVVKYPGGKTATIDVCRQAPYGYDQRAEVLGLKGMIATDNMYPNTARIFTKDSTRHADLPYDFFMSRYKEAYLQETREFVKCLAEDGPVPCSGEDGLIALMMAIAAEKSALEGRWVDFKEIPINAIHCDPSGTHCSLDENEAAEVEAKNKSKRSQVKGWIRDAVGFLKKEGEGSGNKKKLRSG